MATIATSLPSWKNRASLDGVKNPQNVEFYSQQQQLSSSASHERCTYYLSRKKRLCSHRVARPGSKFCTFHKPNTLSQLQRESECRQVMEKMIAATIKGCGSTHQASAATSLSTDTDAHNSSALRVKRKRQRKPRTSAPKRMVNPFSTFYSQSLLLPKTWGRVFSDPLQPLTIDVGCARGTLLDKLALKHPDQNFLGIEIRPKLVAEALERTKHIQNLHFVAGKFSDSEAERLIKSLERGVIRAICFQFPDPWRKQKQLRRRVLQPQLAAVLSEKLHPGCYIYISSDVKDVCQGMHDMLNSQAKLKWVRQDEPGLKSLSPVAKMGPQSCESGASKHGGDDIWWLKQSFLGEPSERGLVCEQDWRVVWRGVFVVVE